MLLDTQRFQEPSKLRQLRGVKSHLPLRPGSQDNPSDGQGQQFFVSSTPETWRLEKYDRRRI